MKIGDTVNFKNSYVKCDVYDLEIDNNYPLKKEEHLLSNIEGTVIARYEDNSEDIWASTLYFTVFQLKGIKGYAILHTTPGGYSTMTYWTDDVLSIYINTNVIDFIAKAFTDETRSLPNISTFINNALFENFVLENKE